jgi:hypothetical protein
LEKGTQGIVEEKGGREVILIICERDGKFSASLHYDHTKTPALFESFDLV